ncbi:MAG: stage IV sporulation protein A [Lachnospiraceae bacterium]|nr:stage IV sporulation protein A [Lachnospiraceae bacterium]
MENFHVYRDIEARTGGEIYIGVVGPVRTGKSTFIKRFMETMVLPKLPDGHKKTLTRDELPQSAAGKMIMTTEPKFIPKEAAEIHLEDGIHAKIRLVDCVGFMVDGAVGHEENGEERLVKTPWFDHEIPFTYAAEIGTRKVIRDHSTIGIVITGDGSFGELGRNDYADAEARIIRELKEIGKPFIVLLNSVKPFGEEAKEMAGNMEELYGVTVQPVNCEQLKESDVKMILMNVLKEFPVQKLDFYIPKWMEILPDEHPLKMTAIEHARSILTNVDQMKDMKEEILRADGNSRVSDIVVRKTEMADGTVSVEILMDYDCYYEVISEYTGIPVKDEYVLFHTLAKLSDMQGEYEKVKHALSQVRAKGYGIVMPDKSEIVLSEPELIKHGNKFGVKIHAQAPSINLIKAQIETEIAPIVGSEQQANDLISYIKNNEATEDGVWETNIFGKSVEQIVTDGMQTKISQMTEDCQSKLQDTLQKIINDSNGGMICIII